MPVVTRNQKKNMNNSAANIAQVNLLKDVTPIRECAKNTISNQNNDAYFEKKRQFVSKVKDLLVEVEMAIGKQNKVNKTIEIFTIVNNGLAEMFEKEPEIWCRFNCTVYNKASEFEELHELNDLDICTEESVAELMRLCKEVKVLCAKHIKNTKYDYKFPNDNSGGSLKHLEYARHLINKEENGRKLRNGKRVNYAGMDMPTIINVKDMRDNNDKYNWAGSYNDYFNIAVKQRKYEAKDPDYEPFVKQTVCPEAIKEEVKKDLKENIVMTITENNKTVNLLKDVTPIRKCAKKISSYSQFFDDEDVVVNVCKTYFKRENGKLKVTNKWTKQNANEVDDSEYLPESEDEEY